MNMSKKKQRKNQKSLWNCMKIKVQKNETLEGNVLKPILNQAGTPKRNG